MTQSSYTLDNKSGALFRADLNTLAAAIQSGNSGATAPTDTRGGMVWVDTSTTPATLRVRNAGDTAWVALGTLGTDFAVAGLTIASQSDAETGTDNAKLMTPLRTEQAVTFQTTGRIASQSEAETGADATKLMTPQRVAQAIAAQSVSLGVGQTWQNVLSSRAALTSYQNTTGKPISVAISVSAGSGGNYIQVSSNNSTWIDLLLLGDFQYSFIVPHNWYYRVNGAVTLARWAELR
jgi:hypothetical protein